MMYPSGLRLDKWLWYTRLMASRSVAATVCESRHLRLDGRVIDRAHTAVRPGQVISFPKAGEVLVVRVLSVPARRGPAAEARGHYQLLSQSRLQPATQNRYDPSQDCHQPERGA